MKTSKCSLQQVMAEMWNLVILVTNTLKMYYNYTHGKKLTTAHKTNSIRSSLPEGISAM